VIESSSCSIVEILTHQNIQEELMKDKIITIYCLCDEMLKALGQRDDQQCRMNTAEVMTTALVAALFFKAIKR